jgi:hypothetical protein
MSLLATATTGQRRLMERRSGTRYRCHRVGHARPNGTALGLSWGVTLLNLSVRGALLELREPLAVGDLLVIQAAGEKPPPSVTARIIRVAPWGGRWLCGVALLEPLTEDVLRSWLG